MDRLAQLYLKLGLNKKNGLFLFKESAEWIHKFPYRISRILKEVIKPEAFFCLYNDGEAASDHPQPFNQSFILFFNNPTDEEEELIHKRVLNFGLAQAVFINRSNTLDLFHGNEFKKGGFKKLIQLRNSANLDDFGEFSFVNVLLGNSLKHLGVKKNQIDKYLLNNITDVRRILVAKAGLNLLPKAANRLIGRLLFISYLIDRDVTFSDQDIVLGNTKYDRKESFKKTILSKSSLYKFFQYLNNKYNGDMFPLKEYLKGRIVYNEKDLVEQKHLDLLYHLFNCSEIFKTGEDYNGYVVQESLFDLYDFEIIPVELISSIYENFIGNEFENEKLNLSKQKEIKAYYTPPYLVDYVLSQTVTPFLENTLGSNCKVLDPACGSGIFLVETLRKIIEKELYVSGKTNFSDAKLWTLIKSNIFGIDIDSDAIDISIFSLYITILDYKQPAEIEKFRFRKLKDENFFGGSEADFFNLNHPFNKKLKNLDFIIGNPPWGQVTKSKYIEYIINRDKVENNNKREEERISLQIGDKEICQAFLVRTSDFAKTSKSLKCSFVISSKVLYNTEDSSKTFRSYFLQKFHVKQVVELSPVNNKIRGGNHIFDHARQPAAVITFIPEIEEKPTSRNIIQHITVKPNRFFFYYKTIVVEKHDVKNIKQEYFMTKLGGYDWLWKVLVHGNALDIHFIKRLRNSFKSVEEYFQSEQYTFKGGLKLKDSDKKSDSSRILNYDYLDAEKEFRPYIALPSKKWKRELEINDITSNQIGYLPDLKYFDGNKLLIKKGLVLEPEPGEHLFGAVSAFNDGKICFTATVCSIKPEFNDIAKSKLFLSTLSGLFNSKFFTYFLLNTSSSAGIERTRIHFSEFFQFPLQLHQEIGTLALAITNKLHFGESQSYIDKNAIEEIIHKIYDISEVEASLIDYSLNVSIPVLLREHDSKIFKSFKFTAEEETAYINEYIRVFTNYFKKRFQRINKYLFSEVLFSDFFVRINFHLSDSLKNSTVSKTDNEDLEILLGDLGVYNVCKDLYFQQDVRGFTKNSFYIIKPNERKLWHTAIGYLDAIEFEEEIIKAEINQSKTNPKKNERS